MCFRIVHELMVNPKQKKNTRPYVVDPKLAFGIDFYPTAHRPMQFMGLIWVVGVTVSELMS